MDYFNDVLAMFLDLDCGIILAFFHFKVNYPLLYFQKQNVHLPVHIHIKSLIIFKSGNYYNAAKGIYEKHK